MIAEAYIDTVQRKLWQILQFCGYLQKFLCEILGSGIFWHGKKRAIRERFLRENRIFHQLAKEFSLEVSRYTVAVKKCSMHKPVYFNHTPVPDIHAYIHPYIHTYIHTYIHSYIYTYIQTQPQTKAPLAPAAPARLWAARLWASR